MAIRLYVRWVQLELELELGMLVFCGEKKNQENQEKKPLTKGWDKQQT